MTVLWINLGLVYVFSFLARYITIPLSIGTNLATSNKLLIFLAIATLVLVSGLRNNIGDTYFYIKSYEDKDFTWEYIVANKDPGFGILQMLLQTISKDPQLLIFITALITNILIGITLYKYSRMIELSFYVYITAGMFTVSMNGIRQFLAASIIFIATKYILNGDFKKYALLVILASTIHQSALILIPIYFIVRREAWTKVTFLLFVLAIVIVFGFNQFSEMLFASIEDTQYSKYSTFDEGGASSIRVLVDSIPVIIAFLGREKLRKMWPKSDIIVNLAVINLIFMIIATQNWIFARFNIYFSLYNLILISWIIYLFKENSRKFVYYGLLVCYLVYFYYEQVISLNMDYQSDYMNL
ncbi:EpsG family protein [Metabacillus halosaccharovorans]|uniref:EpsG family protein n=1 Tax=Metabacillus halosaccharovorans TaxID=930124 RepID=UPI001C1F3900|nr:EpsG family protein [Metabacillus halosaccharovorans]MBU7593525.1 EpsG family protein [Metabacillus halosaccharovorans]